jgi:putative transcriptional regulator
MNRAISKRGPKFIATLLLVMLVSILLSKIAFCFQSIPLHISRGTLSETDWIGRIPPDQNLAQGKFLVAARKLRDPNFSQTVVLLIQYDKNGAMGVIINRPTDMNLSMVLPDHKALQKRGDTIFLGGPVFRDQLLLLVQTDVQPEESLQVFQNVYVSSAPKVIEQMIKNEAKGDRFRVFAGYAGWAPGQLYQEMKRGDWHILPAKADIIFNQTPAEIWPELILRGSVKYVKMHIREILLSSKSDLK